MARVPCQPSWYLSLLALRFLMCPALRLPDLNCALRFQFSPVHQLPLLSQCLASSLSCLRWPTKHSQFQRCTKEELIYQGQCPVLSITTLSLGRSIVRAINQRLVQATFHVEKPLVSGQQFENPTQQISGPRQLDRMQMMWVGIPQFLS